MCAEYAKLGMMGTTVVYASGDDGVGGIDGLCLNEDGAFLPEYSPLVRLTQSCVGQPDESNGFRFSPTFPSTCPFVTSAGGTMLPVLSSVTDPEVAWDAGNFDSSGGGFSNIFQVPSYQAEAVTTYLTNNPPSFPSDRFNSSGNVS